MKYKIDYLQNIFNPKHYITKFPNIRNKSYVKKSTYTLISFQSVDAF